MGGSHPQFLPLELDDAAVDRPFSGRQLQGVQLLVDGDHDVFDLLAIYFLELLDGSVHALPDPASVNYEIPSLQFGRRQLLNFQVDSSLHNKLYSEISKMSVVGRWCQSHLLLQTVYALGVGMQLATDVLLLDLQGCQAVAIFPQLALVIAVDYQ